MRVFGLMVAISLLVGCAGLTPAGEKAVRDGIAVNEGHMNDASLPQPARDIAQDNFDLGWQLLYHEGVVGELPPAVRARYEARKPSGEGQ